MCFEQVDWFFSEDDLDDLSRLSVNLSLPTDSCEVEPTSNHNLLLNNIQKVEGTSRRLIIFRAFHCYLFFTRLSFISFCFYFVILSMYSIKNNILSSLLFIMRFDAAVYLFRSLFLL